VRPTRIRAATTSVLLIALSVCARATEHPPFIRLAPERVAVAATQVTRDASQFLQADAKGRVFLLYGDDLEVDQILPSGRIVSWHKPDAKDTSDAEVSEAALSPDGSSWLLCSGPDELMLLSGDVRRKLPPPHWWVSACAYTTDGPVIAVLPGHVGGSDAAGQTDWDEPPLLLRLDDQKWQVLSTQQPPRLDDQKWRPSSGQKPPLPSFEEIKADRDTRLAAGRKGALWVAQQNAYLLRRFSRLGAVEESVAVNGGGVQWQERTEEDWSASEKAAQAAGVKYTRSRHSKMGALRVVRGLTAQDNRVYLVVETPEGVALDRWDTASQVLDRVLLAGIEPGRLSLSLAAGKDGLYIAERRLGDPIWRLDWQRLEHAKWQPVPGGPVQ
jgi:hypothetical protein